MILALAICLIGLVLYGLPQTEHPKVTRAGEIMFGVGLFAFLFLYKGGFKIEF